MRRGDFIWIGMAFLAPLVVLACGTLVGPNLGLAVALGLVCALVTAGLIVIWRS